MSYGLILSNQFTSDCGSWRWEILQRDVSDDEEEIEAGGQPFIYSNSTSEEFQEATIIAGSASVNIIASSLYLYDFINADDREYIGRLLHYNGVSYDEKWRGYLIPTTYTQEYGDTPVNMYVSFSDLLGDLENIEFVNNDDLQNDSDIFTSNNVSELDIISFILRKLDVEGIDTLHVALSYFEDSHNNTSTDTPLPQTYFDPSLFYKSEVINGIDTVTQSETAKDVLSVILIKYTAKIIQWEEAYWIIDFFNQKSETINYVTYDLESTQTGTGSIPNSRISFKSDTLSDKFRWKGRQQIQGTGSYKKIILKLEGDLNKGLAYEFLDRNVYATQALGFRRFGETSNKNWKVDFFKSNADLDFFITKAGVYSQNKVLYESPDIDPDISGNTELQVNFTFQDRESSNSGAIIEDTIKYKSGDEAILKIDIGGISFPYMERYDIPYFTLKWHLKVGSYYYDYINESWGLSQLTNEVFLSDIGYNKPYNNEYKIKFRDVAETTEAIEIKVYMPTVSEYDLSASNESAMVTALTDVDTSSFSIGQRYITRHEATWAGGAEYHVYFFYELLNEYEVDGSSPDKVVPSDNGNYAWNLVQSYNINVPNELSSSRSTRSILRGVNLITLPQGRELEETISIEKGLNSANIAVYETSLRLFDYPGGVNNSEHIYKNVLKDSNEVPLDSWEQDGITSRIQVHRLNTLAELLKSSRQRIGGEVYIDVEPSPLKTFLVSSDNNRIYYAKDMNINFKASTINAGFEEIANDTSVTTRAHEVASHSSGHS